MCKKKLRIEIIKEMLKEKRVVFSYPIPHLYIERGTYIRILRLHSVDIIQTGKNFDLSYTSLSDDILDKIIGVLRIKN